MQFRLPALILAATLCLAQVQMTVEQLRAFVASSTKLGHSDKKIAEYLKNIRLSEKLDDLTVVELQAQGAGPRTVEALRVLEAASVKLARPTPPPPKPVAAPIPPPDSSEQARVLSEAREYGMDYSKRLPNFICTQVTRRYVDESGLEFWSLIDTVIAKLTFFEQKEDYKVVLLNNRVVDTTMERLGGSVSTGEFGSMMRELFDPETQTSFQWERWGTLRGRRMHVYSYRVAQPNSKWLISFEKTARITPAYKGLIYVDRDSSAIMRITAEPVGMPASFPIQQVASILDYDFADIAGTSYVVPLKAVSRMRADRFLTKNDIEFRFYKRFGAEATIRVGEALPEDREQPPTQQQQ